MFNLGKTQDLNELQKKGFFHIQIFRLAYDDYITKYEKYNMPENYSLLEVINLVKKWMDNVPDDKKFMYQGMINLFTSSNNKEFDEKFKSYSEKCKNAKMDSKKYLVILLVYIIITNKDVKKQKMKF